MELCASVTRIFRIAHFPLCDLQKPRVRDPVRVAPNPFSAIRLRSYFYGPARVDTLLRKSDLAERNVASVGIRGKIHFELRYSPSIDGDTSGWTVSSISVDCDYIRDRF